MLRWSLENVTESACTSTAKIPERAIEDYDQRVNKINSCKHSEFPCHTRARSLHKEFHLRPKKKCFTFAAVLSLRSFTFRAMNSRFYLKRKKNLCRAARSSNDVTQIFRWSLTRFLCVRARAWDKKFLSSRTAAINHESTWLKMRIQQKLKLWKLSEWELHSNPIAFQRSDINYTCKSIYDCDARRRGERREERIESSRVPFSNEK